MRDKNINAYIPLFALGVIVVLVFFSYGKNLTGRAVFVLDDTVTGDQIAVIAKLADFDDETRMLSEVNLDEGGYVVFKSLSDSGNAMIKESGGYITVTGNVKDAVDVMKKEDVESLLEKYNGIIEIVDGEIVVKEEIEEEKVEEIIEEEKVEEIIEEEKVEEIEEEKVEEIDEEKMEEIIEVVESMTIADFITDIPSNTVVVIPSGLSSDAMLGAVILAGGLDVHVVKAAAYTSGPAIILGGDATALFTLNIDEEGNPVLVISPETKSQMRKAVRILIDEGKTMNQREMSK